MLALRFHLSTLKELASLTPKHYKQFISKLFLLMSEPQQNGTRQLEGIDDQMFRVSSGEYRIAYRYTDSDLFIEAIGARNDDLVYRMIPQQK